MNKPELVYAYYDSARIFLESKLIDYPEDSRLYSSLGIAYAGLRQKDKAINAGKKAVELLPISKEAWRGVYRAGDLAQIYVMVGEYEAALEQIDLLLSIPGHLSTKLLQLDPVWKPLWNHPEFKKLLETYSED
jgi:tetratricopeptide (TPR) repeat protein